MLLEMVEVLLVLGQPTSPPKNLILAETGIIGGYFISDSFYRIPMTSSFSKYYSVDALGGSIFGVVGSDDKGCVFPRNTHITSQKVYCWIDGGNFVIWE